MIAELSQVVGDFGAEAVRARSLFGSKVAWVGPRMDRRDDACSILNNAVHTSRDNLPSYDVRAVCAAATTVTTDPVPSGTAAMPSWHRLRA